LFDCINEIKNVFIGFEKDIIKFVNTQRPSKEDGEIIAEGEDIVVTPAFIDSHSHIGLQRSAEYSEQYEENEQMDPFTPLANALHSIIWTTPCLKNQ
jgi:imidazolonepropionase-like amidohydrolase